MKKDLAASLLLVLLVGILLFIVFKPVINSPNNYLFSHGGDAVKSYFNFSYYLKFDEGVKHDGANYPFGDHLQYINSHPFHSAVCKIANKVLPISPYGVAIVNLLMITALLLAVPFMYLVLRKFQLPVWYSFVVALIIMFLSPQLDRVKGHFEMVYLYFIPMYWYFLIRFREGEKHKWLWAIALIITGIIGGFTSAYFASFYSIFILSVLFADLWINRKNIKPFLKQGATLLIIAIIPLLIVKGFVDITDWADVRPYNPWGFYVFHSNLLTILFPPDSYLQHNLSQFFNVDATWEGRAYIGLPAVLLILWLVFASIKNLLNKRLKKINHYKSDTLSPYLIGSVLVLLFSMCIPFKYGFGFLLEFLGPVKQFRALGRFAWVFYYVFTVFTAFYVYKLFADLKEKKKILATAFLMLALGSWSVEAYVNAKKSFSGIFLENNLLESDDEPYNEMLKKANIDVNDFQAILFVPYANTSGDKFQFERGLHQAFGEAMRCSYHTGLPLVQSFEPRLPYSDALSSIQLLADSAIAKTRISKMNGKPILLLSTHEQLTQNEKILIDKSEPLYSDNRIGLASLDIKSFALSHDNWLQHANSVIPFLVGNDTIRADVPINKIYYLDFEYYKAENCLSGSGALFKRRNTLQVFNKQFYSLGFEGSYELSFWMFFDTRAYGMPKPVLLTTDKNGNVDNEIELNHRENHNVYNNWVRIENEIHIEPDKIYSLKIKGKYVTIDNLLLKPKGSNVAFTDGKSKVWLNNFALE